jgi:hypothetical protein
LYKLSVNNGTSDGGIFRLYNEEVGLNVAIDGTTASPTYTGAPRTVVLNATRMDSGTSPKLRLAGQGGLELAVDANTVKMVIDSGGNVGIGTTNPAQKLEVDGGIKISNGNSRLYFGTEGGTSYRALEGSTNGSLLQVGENYTNIALQGNVAIQTTSPDSSASMGGQTPALSVVGYTSLDGLRVAGGDTGNTIYKTGGNIGIVSASHAVNVTGSTQVNLTAGSNTMFRAAVNKWSLGGGTYGHGKIRSYHYHGSLSIGQTVALMQNTGAHTDINFIYWIEAFHSSRSYRTGMGTFGGYGMHKSSASNGGLDIYGTAAGTGIMRLDIAANTSYATSYHISMLIFGDSGITVHNGTLADGI